jgi:hypothetical protein
LIGVSPAFLLPQNHEVSGSNEASTNISDQKKLAIAFDELAGAIKYLRDGNSTGVEQHITLAYSWMSLVG